MEVLLGAEVPLSDEVLLFQEIHGVVTVVVFQVGLHFFFRQSFARGHLLSRLGGDDLADRVQTLSIVTIAVQQGLEMH